MYLMPEPLPGRLGDPMMWDAARPIVGALQATLRQKEARAIRARAAGLGGGRLNAPLRAACPPCHEQPVVEPQVSHFRQVPLRTRVKLAQLGQGSPS
jgi:hypothetical protein